jgi:hypothetical protein
LPVGEVALARAPRKRARFSRVDQADGAAACPDRLIPLSPAPLTICGSGAGWLSTRRQAEIELAGKCRHDDDAEARCDEHVRAAGTFLPKLKDIAPRIAGRLRPRAAHG